MTTRLTIERVAGNIGPDLLTTVEDVDLTQVTSITAIVRYENGQRLEKACSIIDAAAGTFSLEWAAGDLIDGDHTIEWRFVVGTEITTLPEGTPHLLRVRQRI